MKENPSSLLKGFFIPVYSIPTEIFLPFLNSLNRAHNL